MRRASSSNLIALSAALAVLSCAPDTEPKAKKLITTPTAAAEASATAARPAASASSNSRISAPPTYADVHPKGPAEGDASKDDRSSAAIAILSDGSAKDLPLEDVEPGRSFEPDLGQRLDTRGEKPPKIRTLHVDASSGLPPEVIQRIVRQSFGRFRICYQEALKTKPDLTGKVAVRFVVAMDGSVKDVKDGGSEMPDKTMVDCVVRSFKGMSFPEPDGSEVNVLFPLSFSPPD